VKLTTYKMITPKSKCWTQEQLLYTEHNSVTLKTLILSAEIFQYYAGPFNWAAFTASCCSLSYNYGVTALWIY